MDNNNEIVDDCKIVRQIVYNENKNYAIKEYDIKNLVETNKDKLFVVSSLTIGEDINMAFSFEFHNKKNINYESIMDTLSYGESAEINYGHDDATEYTELHTCAEGFSDRYSYYHTIYNLTKPEKIKLIKLIKKYNIHFNE
jgi:hypothetical protein